MRTEFPDGTESKVVFDAWYQESWDQNDCVTGSRWLTERLEPGAPADERTAAVQTQDHADTPSLAYFDSLGRAYLTVEDNGTHGNYETRMAFDIEGNIRSVTDQRGITAFTYKCDIAGTKVFTNNPDAGERWIFTDTMDNPVRTWDSRGHVQRVTYDVLRRATHTYVQQGTNPEQLMTRTIYGESISDPLTGNHRGKVYQVFDGAGVLTSNSYDFKGNLLSSTRHIAKEYHQTPNWDVIGGLTDVNAIWTAAQSSLETQSYASSTVYDALNRVVRSTTPDGSVTRPVYNEANLLESLELNHRGTGTFTPIVENVDYNARGQRTIIEYANGVDTSYEYDPFTFRMTRLISTRSSDSLKLQDYQYTFDPVGNIVVFRDNSDWSHLFTRAPVSGDGLYVYDPIYRLIEATGREHPGQQPINTDPVRGNVPHQNDLQALLRYTEQYEYDEAGNITGMTHTASGNNWNRGYQYSTSGNKLLGTTAPGDPAGTYSNTYTYNAHGSIITMPHISQLNWNYVEQLQSTDLDGGGIVYYSYDSGGTRVRKVYEHSGVTEERIYLGGYEIYRRRVGATLSLERQTLHVSDDSKRIVLFETKTVDVDNPAGLPQVRVRWQLDNHLGSSGTELDSSAQVISYEEYHPFGSTSFHTVDSGTEVSAKRYRYTGKERDDETGLYYYRARYYASWLGRWMGCDPSGAVDGLNLYAYVKNNPVVLVDPNGMESKKHWTPDTHNPGQNNIPINEIPSGAEGFYAPSFNENNELTAQRLVPHEFEPIQITGSPEGNTNKEIDSTTEVPIDNEINEKEKIITETAPDKTETIKNNTDVDQYGSKNEAGKFALQNLDEVAFGSAIFPWLKNLEFSKKVEDIAKETHENAAKMYKDFYKGKPGIKEAKRNIKKIVSHSKKAFKKSIAVTKGADDALKGTSKVLGRAGFGIGVALDVFVWKEPVDKALATNFASAIGGSIGASAAVAIYAGITGVAAISAPAWVAVAGIIGGAILLGTVIGIGWDLVKGRKK